MPLIAKEDIEYFISKDTMVITPSSDERGYLYSIVMEKEQTINIPLKPLDLIKESSGFYGASYEGRLHCTEKLTGFRNKLPLCLSEILQIFICPLESPINETCTWLSLEYIRKVYSEAVSRSLILLENGDSITVDYSKATIEQNLQWTAYFKDVFLRRFER